METDHPFFRPLWIRVVVVGFCVAWAAFEFYGGSSFWGMLFLAMGGISFHGFFIAFDPDGKKKPQASHPEPTADKGKPDHD
ncbi:MAG: DUF3329 domain-containing protein [Rhizobiaceae bacterium]|nr:DUF3329 domain-containing protein [Rhizobiaceae bacterium]